MAAEWLTQLAQVHLQTLRRGYLDSPDFSGQIYKDPWRASCRQSALLDGRRGQLLKHPEESLSDRITSQQDFHHIIL